MNVRRGFVASGGEQIYWQDAGSGDVVVLSHGFGGNHASWYQQVPVFAKERRVVTWDHRGFGRSTNRGRRPGPGTGVEDLRALLKHVGAERVHLVGQSMGGWTALGFALEEPERVHSLVLADSIGGIYTPEIRKHFDSLVAQAPKEEAPEFDMKRHPALGEVFGQEAPELALLYHEIGSLAGPPPPEIPGLLLGTAQSDEAVSKLPFRTLFVVGSEDPIFPPDLIRSAAARVPNSRVVEIHETGHSPYFEDPVSWNEAVLSFWMEHR